MKAESDHFVLTDALAFVALPRLRPVKGNGKASSQYDNVRQQRRGSRANWRVATMLLMRALLRAPNVTARKRSNKRRGGRSHASHGMGMPSFGDTLG